MQIFIGGKVNDTLGKNGQKYGDYMWIAIGRKFLLVLAKHPYTKVKHSKFSRSFRHFLIFALS